MGRTSALTNVVFALLPGVVGFTVAVVIGLGRTTSLMVALALATASLIALVAVKLPRLRAGYLIGFGPSQAATRQQRWLWWLAVALICLSVVIGGLASQLRDA